MERNFFYQILMIIDKYFELKRLIRFSLIICQSDLKEYLCLHYLSHCLKISYQSGQTQRPPHLVASYAKQGVLRTYSYPIPHETFLKTLSFYT